MPKTPFAPFRYALPAVALAAAVAGCATAQPLPERPPPPSSATAPGPTAPTHTAQTDPAYGYWPSAPVEPAPAPVRREGNIALLLPLSGNFSATGEAVRDGFLSAHFNDGARGNVRVYDVGSGDEALMAVFQRALNEGADFVVGPLRKESVAMLAALNPPVPVLGLNFLDAGTPLPFNFFQMGLAPEDEARAAADHAAAQGLRRAVALVPETDWGERALAAFSERLRQNGGSVMRAERYPLGRATEQSKAIEGLMGVAASQERHRALTSILGVKTEFEAKRRSDLDLIFMVARAQDARLLGPQFRFHRATGLPIYATALVYDGRSDADRAGMRFCDTPWTVGDSAIWAPSRAEVESLPTTVAQPRLYALGRDAQRVSAGLLRGELRVGEAVDGASGRLRWRGHQIERGLDCVQIETGGLRPLSGTGLLTP
ncbi:MAG TPA: penicillin-binding protein activator [Solimonas sp.]